MKKQLMIGAAACLLMAACKSKVPDELVASYVPPSTTDLIISEWACTSTATNGYRTTYFELYNGTGTTVDLTKYVALYRSNSNTFGQTAGDTLRFTGMLAHGKAIVIGRPEVDTSLVHVDVYWNNLKANGNDGVMLAKLNGTAVQPLDLLGNTTQPATTGEAVAGVADATVDKVLLRKYSVNGPTTNWPLSAGTDTANSQWEVHEKTYYINAGKPTGAN